MRVLTAITADNLPFIPFFLMEALVTSDCLASPPPKTNTFDSLKKHSVSCSESILPPRACLFTNPAPEANWSLESDKMIPPLLKRIY